MGSELEVYEAREKGIRAKNQKAKRSVSAMYIYVISAYSKWEQFYVHMCWGILESKNESETRAERKRINSRSSE